MRPDALMPGEPESDDDQGKRADIDLAPDVLLAVIHELRANLYRIVAAQTSDDVRIAIAESCSALELSDGLEWDDVPLPAICNHVGDSGPT